MTEAIAAPAVIQCDRCHVRLQIGPKGNADARPLRRSQVPEGVCINCATTLFLKTTEPAGMLLEQGGPEMLRMEHIREQFGRILQAGNADAKLDEIDWDVVISNWDLPIKKPKKRRL